MSRFVFATDRRHTHKQHIVRQDAEGQALCPGYRGAGGGVGSHGQRRDILSGFQHQREGVCGEGFLPGELVGGVKTVPFEGFYDTTQQQFRSHLCCLIFMEFSAFPAAFNERGVSRCNGVDLFFF